MLEKRLIWDFGIDRLDYKKSAKQAAADSNRQQKRCSFYLEYSVQNWFELVLLDVAGAVMAAIVYLFFLQG